MTQNDLFDATDPEQYRQIFGDEKIALLWDEFSSETEKEIKDIGKKSLEEIRLRFHSWRSSAKIFGLKSFVQECEIIENMVLDGENSEKIKKTVDNCEKTFHNAQKEANRFFDRCKHGKFESSK